MPGPSTYFDPSRIGELDPGERDLVARRARVLGSAYQHTAKCTFRVAGQGLVPCIFQ